VNDPVYRPGPGRAGSVLGHSPPPQHVQLTSHLAFQDELAPGGSFQPGVPSAVNQFEPSAYWVDYAAYARDCGPETVVDGSAAYQPAAATGQGTPIEVNSPAAAVPQFAAPPGGREFSPLIPLPNLFTP
jgi:hypothetical protein